MFKNREDKESPFVGIGPQPTKIINLTPHDINIVVGAMTLTVPRSGELARVSMNAVPQRDVFVDFDRGDGFLPIVFNKPGTIEGLPEPADNTIYLVSIVVLGATDRKDVYAPDTGPTAIRNDKGQIQAVTRLLAARKTRDTCPCCGLLDDICERETGLCFSCAEGMNEE